MDMQMLHQIAKAFVCENKRERFLFDMTRKSNDAFGFLPRGQMDAIHRLPAIIDRSLILMESMSFPPPDRLIELMRQNGVDSSCFVLSEYADMIGVVAPLKDAVDRLHINGFPSLIVGLPSGFAHLKRESWASKQPNCFVKPRIRLDGRPWEN